MNYYRNGREIAEADALDEHGTVRDGVAMRVPLMMRDHIRDANRFDDAWRFGPGPVRLADDAELARLRALHDEAYRLKEIADVNAWRGSPPEQKTADACVGYSASPGNAPVDSFTLDLDPHSPTFNLAAARSLRDAAYAEAELADANRWRIAK